jgi:hypothetical protein
VRGEQVDTREGEVLANRADVCAVPVEVAAEQAQPVSGPAAWVVRRPRIGTDDVGATTVEAEPAI